MTLNICDPPLSTLQHRQRVALDVDEISAVYDWRTVMVQGSVRFLTNDRSSPGTREQHLRVASSQTVHVDHLGERRRQPTTELHLLQWGLDQDRRLLHAADC